MHLLITLQKLHFDSLARKTVDRSEIEQLRAQVPVPILAHFDRLLSRGKKGVAMARHGVCNECHLRIPNGKLVELSSIEEVHLCDNCGRYLYLPDDELAVMKANGPAGSLDQKAARVAVAPSR